MSIHLVRGLAVAALFAVASQALAAVPTPTLISHQDAAVRPAVVPSNYVVTPNGYFHPSCVHHIAAGETVLANGNIRAANGSVRRTAACGYPRYTKAGDRIDPGVSAPVISGWTAYSDTDPNAASVDADVIQANWVVPSAPRVQAGQVVYFFPGLEQAPNVVTILQPVLGWNAFNDNKWTLASWNCCVNGQTNYSTPVDANPGDSVYGVAYVTCSAGSVCDTWQIMSQNQTSGASTILATSAYGQAFNWFFGGVLEAYGVAACGQYPANGSVDFTNIEVYDTDFNLLTPTWQTSTTNARPQCSYTVNATTSETSISFDTRGR